MDFILLLRLAYLGPALLILLLYPFPALSSRFLAYGPRTTSKSPVRSAHGEQKPEQASAKVPGHQADSALLATILDRLAAIKVLHSWFTSFYVLSVTCSLFWASQLFTHGPGFRAVADRTSERHASMTVEQVIVAWILMFAQGSRRLYECLTLNTPSRSQMWVGHWVLGIIYYLCNGMAVWVEGVPALQNHTFSPSDLVIKAPSLRTIASILLFLLASGTQHDCHAYLASLKSTRPAESSHTTQATGPTQQPSSSSYKLPTHPAFSALIAPHYTAECVIYIALAVCAAPQGAWVNWTVVCGLVFVVVNLGITADGTREWYRERFGREAVQGRWRMVPYVW